MKLDESSLSELYASAVRAFPNTRKRQYATDPLKTVEMTWMPYKGMKTLYVSGRVVNEGRNYQTIILFKDVEYDPYGAVRLIASDGLEYRFAPLSQAHSEVVVRCNCPDFRWRFNTYNADHGSLYGRRAPAYVPGHRGGPPANPMALEGMCKHLMATTRAISRAGAFQQ